MTSQDPTPPRGPPTAFLAGQSRARRRKAGSSDAGVAGATAHNLESIYEAGHARNPDEQPKTEPFHQKEDEPVLDRQHEAVPFSERQHEPILPQDPPVEPEPVTQPQGDIAPVPDPENDNAQVLFRQAFSDPAPIPRVDGVNAIEPRLTQHNTQHNTQNTYNYTYNHNTLLARAPLGFAKAIEDVDSWMRRLKANSDIETHLASDDFFFTGYEGYDSIALVGVGGIRDAWVVLAHDISIVEKDMKHFFGPLDKEISNLLKYLRSQPATARCLQETRSSGFWNGFFEWILGSRRESSLDIVHKNLDLALSFYSRASLASQVFPEATYTGIHQRLSDLKKATCRLRNSVEASCQGLSRKIEIGKGIAAVVNRGNILCNMFEETERRFRVMNELIKYLANLNRDGKDLEQRLALLGAMKMRPATEVHIVEEEIAEWVEEIAEPVGKLRRLDLD
ncbi:hypothetical protein CEP54_014585 [Fusarium duplospermum]|uniref:Uncharacterized protein n=1 Tax=Fusarium duplospermum TaxID=1325734 RepID=A0A428NVA2_9HYPO|nr:hypothetical protein CEP54_014585 [Fusarium duplospermum]